MGTVTPNEKMYGRHDGTGGPSSSNSAGGNGTKGGNGVALPKAAEEIDFEVANPPMDCILPPSDHPVCDSPAAINSDDVLCGRGGGTNSQIGNRRFRKLVQEFQPTYLMARRKEKPLLARTIVLIIRKRGGRFLKKDDSTGELYEVGDAKAEAKTSQALREGLDVRATKSASSSGQDKKKKKKKGLLGTGKEQGEDSPIPNTIPSDKASTNGNTSREDDENENESIVTGSHDTIMKSPLRSGTSTPRPTSPPALPHVQQEGKAGVVHPHSPEALQFRKRRRMRSTGCIPLQDKLFPDFCPPRADLQRTGSLLHGDHVVDDDGHSQRGRGVTNGGDDDSVYSEQIPQPGCADIAMTIMTGAANGSFCLGPANWRRK